MTRLLFSLPLMVVLLGALVPGLGHGAEAASGFGPDPAPAERALAERPEPDAWFREMTGHWHGVPGLPALRARWEGFAAEDAGFAVLAALVSESEGKPEEALEKLRALTGSDARWNEGRLLALLGREADAVRVLEGVVTTAERPEMGAAALIALTELDCIRGDFPKALARTTAAWQRRSEEEFRLRILERHLSLLVEAGKEREFLEEQVKAAEIPGDVTGTAAQKRLAVMADWFTADARLQAAREKLRAAWFSEVAPGGMDHPGHMVYVRATMDCGLLYARGQALEVQGQEETGPPGTAWRLAHQISSSRQWPAGLEGLPLLRRVFADRPLALGRMLFSNTDPLQPFPPLLRTLVDGMESGVQRRTMDLVERAWAGRGGLEDAETLAAIIVEVPQLRRGRSAYRPSEGSGGIGGWPMAGRFPKETVTWNLSGESWVDYYRLSCRLAPLANQSSMPEYTREKVPMISWRLWRPSWPADGEGALMIWAWEQLTAMDGATAERAADIARRIPDHGDRFLFAARCGRRELLTEWCRDTALLRQVNSNALMQAAQALQRYDRLSAGGPESEAVLAIARELARRMELNEMDLIRSLGIFIRNAPADMKRELLDRPVDPALTRTLGLRADAEDKALRKPWKEALAGTVPHPLAGLAFCPSVERTRVLNALLLRAREGPRRMMGFSTPLQQVSHVFFGNVGSFWGSGVAMRAPELLAALEIFPTSNPLKRQMARWQAIYWSHKLGENTMDARMRGHGEREAQFDLRLTGALLELAGEEQAAMPWHLVRAMLEQDPVRRALLLEMVRARSLLTAGAGEPPASPPSAEMPHGSASIYEIPTAEALADSFVKLIEDPETRRQVEPAGALDMWLRRSDSQDALVKSFARLSASTLHTDLAERLLQVPDPLAARLAVICIARRNHPDGTAPWLSRALTLFPEDPELLLASAALSSHKGPVPEEGRGAFRRAMASLTGVFPFGPDSQAVWCGITDYGTGRDAETVRALVSFIGRSRPASLPQVWVGAIESAVGSREELPQLTDPEVRAAALAVVAYKKPWVPGQGDSPKWQWLLERLEQAGRPDAAATAAEALLSQPRGPLGFPGSPSEPAPPWDNGSNFQVTGPTAEGWQWLELAGRKDPEGLADRLQAVAAAHPGDEQIALAALLARGRVRSLIEGDLEKLGTLSPAGRHRALAYASWLLTPDRLPDALVLESWEAEAKVEFSDVGNGYRNFLQGNAYLDRLEKAGAVDAVRRLLPALVESVKTIGGLPEGYPDVIFRRLERLGAPDQEARLYAILMGKLKEDIYDVEACEILRALLRKDAEGSGHADFADELDKFVGQAFGGTPKEKEHPAARDRTRKSLARLADTAVSNPRWHGLLRGFLTRNPSLLKSQDPSDPWRQISVLFEVMDSGRLIPETKLRFRSTGAGQGSLSWRFAGVMPPALSEKQRQQFVQPITLPWPQLATPLAGKFDALIIASGEDEAVGDRMMARLEKLPAQGDLTLKGLPLTGNIRLLLIQREAPQSTAETPPFDFNTLPVLLDTAVPPLPRTAHPPGWQFLCEPCPLATSRQWEVICDAGPGTPWEDDVYLLLLDNERRVCAVAAPGHLHISGPADMASRKVSLSQFNIGPGLALSGDQVSIAGPPRYLALAGNTGGWPSRQRENSGAPARFTVQERPLKPDIPDETKITGRLEVQEIRHLPVSRNSSHEHGSIPAIRTSPLQAAWLEGNHVRILDLKKQEEPRTIGLDVPPSAAFQGIRWSGSSLAVLLYISPAEPEKKGATWLFRIDSESSGPPSVSAKFEGRAALLNLAHMGLPAITLIQGDQTIHGILNAEGELMTLSPPAPESPRPPGTLAPYQTLSPTSLACSPLRGQQYPVLDWADGTLRLHFESTPPAPAQEGFPLPAFTARKGFLSDNSSQPPSLWEIPFGLREIQPAGDDKVVGLAVTLDGTSRSVVLLRKVPAQPSP